MLEDIVEALRLTWPQERQTKHYHPAAAIHTVPIS